MERDRNADQLFVKYIFVHFFAEFALPIVFISMRCMRPSTINPAKRIPTTISIYIHRNNEHKYRVLTTFRRKQKRAM